MAILIVAPIGTASARNVVTATINGKRHRWKGRFVRFSAGPYSGVIATASMPPQGGIIRTLGFACPVLLSGASFPLSPDPATCNATYTEEKVRRPITINAWSEFSGVQVTYDNFVNGRVTGTFSAVLNPALGNAAPQVTIQGTFKSRVTAGN